jgi:hypothetical protein
VVRFKEHLRVRPYAPSWSDEEDLTLRRLIDKKCSAQQISDMLPTTRTRNAVIGRAHRLGWSINGGQTTVKVGPGGVVLFAQRKQKVRKVPVQRKRIIKPKPKLIEPRVRNINHLPENPQRLTELPPRSCKYPVRRGDDGEWLMCADARWNDESPYCKDHHQLSYRPAIRRFK